MFVLLVPFPATASYYILNAAEMSPPGVRYPAMESGYQFMIRGEKLEISKL
jgi:hypothetical protein